MVNSSNESNLDPPRKRLQLSLKRNKDQEVHFTFLSKSEFGKQDDKAKKPGLINATNAGGNVVNAGWNAFCNCSVTVIQSPIPPQCQYLKPPHHEHSPVQQSMKNTNSKDHLLS